VRGIFSQEFKRLARQVKKRRMCSGLNEEQKKGGGAFLSAVCSLNVRNVATLKTTLYIDHYESLSYENKQFIPFQ
jgi:hypothetical protein